MMIGFIYFVLADDDLRSHPDVEGSENEKDSGNALEIPWVSATSNNKIAKRKQAILRERKYKWAFKNTQDLRFNRLVTICAQTLGIDATVAIFRQLGRETGMKEYSALIKICVENAKESDNEHATISKAFKFLDSMKEKGLKLEEETYRPLLLFFIGRGMVQKFHSFCEAINDGNSSASPRLGYYEMLLYIGVNDEDKMWELCNRVATNDEEELFSLKGK